MSFQIPSTTVGWFKGLVAAGIGAASNSVTVMIVSPSTFNLHAGLGKLVEVAAVSALVAIAAYLKQAPLPGDTVAKPTA